MTLRHTYSRFLQFGGWRLIRQYAKMGVLGTAVKYVALSFFKGKSIKEAYSRTRAVLDQRLVRQYRPLLERQIKETADEGLHERSKTIWTSWWQGEDEAPQLVKACWKSQQKYMPEGWRHIAITKDNYKEYITLPEHIMDKMKRGIIPQALFSDLVRLELLIKYGGVWMDSTVLCTEPHYPQSLLICPLFMFQYRGTRGEFQGFSNWFISAERGNKALKIVRDLLYQYWRDYDCVVEYYVFHLFVNTLAKEMPEIFKGMPKGNTWPTLMLGNKLAEPYDAQWWDKHTARCCFHKLNYRKENTIGYSYCSHIIGGTDNHCRL